MNTKFISNCLYDISIKMILMAITVIIIVCIIITDVIIVREAHGHKSRYNMVAMGSNELWVIDTKTGNSYLPSVCMQYPHGSETVARWMNGRRKMHCPSPADGVIVQFAKPLTIKQLGIAIQNEFPVYKKYPSQLIGLKSARVYPNLLKHLHFPSIADYASTLIQQSDDVDINIGQNEINRKFNLPEEFYEWKGNKWNPIKIH